MVQALSTKQKLKTLSLKEIRLLGYEWWKKQPTLESGHTDNLKYDDGTFRVWVSRMSLADYSYVKSAWYQDRWTIERLVGGPWIKQ